MNAVASAKEFLDGHAHKGNLLKGIDKKKVRREGKEPIRRVFTYASQQHTFDNITKWFKIAG